MAKRILMAVIAIPIGLAILFLNNNHIFIATMAALAVISTWEVLSATKCIENKPVSIACLAFVAFMPFAYTYDIFAPFIPLICFGFLLILFTIVLFMHEKIKFQKVTLMAFMSLCLSLSFSSISFLQKNFQHGIFYIVFVLASVWIGDAGAYFVGSKIGKHKMAPKISPKKSWEGFFGGLVSSAVFVVLLAIGYPLIDRLMTGTNSFVVNIPYLVIVGFICCILGVLGDFTASILKRQCQVKDFGNFFPGHGGVMDRFDSLLFSMPFAYLIFKIMEPIAPII